MKRSAAFVAFAALLFSTQVLAAADYEASIHASRADTPKPTHDILQVEFWSSDGKPGYLILDATVKSKESYELFGKKGDSRTAIEIDQVVPVPKEGPALQLVIYPKELLNYKKYEAFEFRVKDSSIWKFKGGGGWKNKDGGDFLVIKSKVFEENANYYKRYSGLQNHVDTAHNFKGGILSLSLHYEVRTSEESTNPGAFVFFANAKGDFVLPTKDKGSFFNSVSADGEYVYSHLPNVWASPAPGDAPLDPHNIEPPKNRWEPYWDLGISGKYESDQSFDNENLLAGVVAHVIARNPITDQMQRAILLNGPLFLNPKRIVDVALAPLFTFRYDYVDHTKQDGTIDAGNNRFTGSLFYRLPLARQIDMLKNTALTKQVFDGDFIAEIEVLYDVDKKKVTDNSKLTLEIRPHTDAEHQPSFTFTYAQGKATPTFKHFDALLAGVKIPF